MEQNSNVKQLKGLRRNNLTLFLRLHFCFFMYVVHVQLSSIHVEINSVIVCD